MSDKDISFDCSDIHSIENVANQYEQKHTVMAFLKWACKIELIKKGESYNKVYELIKEVSGLSRKSFNCLKDIEHVASQYQQKQVVVAFLKWICGTQLIKDDPYYVVYDLIETVLGLTRK